MASCQIDIIGTSGSVRVTYTVGTTENTLTANVGEPVYIDDTATNVYFTRLSGDASAYTECIGITELPLTYYMFEWESTGIPKNFIFDGLILGDDTLTIEDVPYDLIDVSKLATSINSIYNYRIKAVSGKVEIVTPRNTGSIYFQVKVIGYDIPYLRIRNEGTPFYLYLIPTSMPPFIPPGFDEFQTCESFTTTTTLSP